VVEEELVHVDSVGVVVVPRGAPREVDHARSARVAVEKTAGDRPVVKVSGDDAGSGQRIVAASRKRRDARIVGHELRARGDPVQLPGVAVDVQGREPGTVAAGNPGRVPQGGRGDRMPVGETARLGGVAAERVARAAERIGRAVKEHLAVRRADRGRRRAVRPGVRKVAGIHLDPRVQNHQDLGGGRRAAAAVDAGVVVRNRSAVPATGLHRAGRFFAEHEDRKIFRDPLDRFDPRHRTQLGPVNVREHRIPVRLGDDDAERAELLRDDGRVLAGEQPHGQRIGVRGRLLRIRQRDAADVRRELERAVVRLERQDRG